MHLGSLEKKILTKILFENAGDGAFGGLNGGDDRGPQSR